MIQDRIKKDKGHCLKKNEPFSFFHRVFNILAVDDSKPVLEQLESYLIERRIFNVTCVLDGTDAARELNTGKYHVCFSDLLGLNYSGNDDFLLIKQFGRKIPIIMFSGMGSRNAVSTAFKEGVFWFFDKPCDLWSKEFNAMFFKAIIETTFIRRFQLQREEECRTALGLLEKMPSSVTEWAGLMDMDERQFRRIFEGNTFQLRDILYTYKLIHMAFECTLSSELLCETDTCKNSELCKKLHEYLYTHLQTVKEIVTL